MKNIAVFWWTLRNPAYNFNYRFNQISDESKVFGVIIFGRLFGYKKDGVPIKGVQFYSWEFGTELI